MLHFDWGEPKNRGNIRKHGVSFEEARTVFADDNALLIADPDHSAHEDRFVMMGMSRNLHVLVVCHCYREGDEIVRLISARKATRKERNFYMENLL